MKWFFDFCESETIGNAQILENQKIKELKCVPQDEE